MPSEEFLTTLNTIINEEGEYSKEEIQYVGSSLIQLYKTILKILNKDGNAEELTTEEGI